MAIGCPSVGDGAPEVVADAIAVLVGEEVDLIVVGPADRARSLLDERGVTSAQATVGQQLEPGLAREV